MTAQLELGLPVERQPSLRHGARRLGKVYTPDTLADWVADELITAVGSLGRSPVVLDPACGDGALLHAIHRQTRGEARLVGIDIDPAAIAASRRRLRHAATVHLADALTGDLESLVEVPDGVIANPPWGAELGSSPFDLRRSGYTLARGQFDSYELFIERMLMWLPEGTPAAFIVPDSIFLPEHEPVRQLLAQDARLELVARLGEGLFPGVFRGTAVLLFRPGAPAADHRVQCLRLRAKDRRRVLADEVTLQSAARATVHLVAQERFRNNARTEFRVDVKERDARTIETMEVPSLEWDRYLLVGRGVELGKSGLIVRCRRCGHGRPYPKQTVFRCASCGEIAERETAAVATIISEDKASPDVPAWRPLIVGEDVDRYFAEASRCILVGIPGINYKREETFRQRKLLVRKTGVGIKAAIDESGAYTTQVVFHIVLRPTAPPFLLDYLQGVLCSRVLLAYHLRRSGESEWRSHPYVTPKTLRDLPIPSLGPKGSRSWRQAEAIADAVLRRTTDASPHDDCDVDVDRLVAGLFRLDSEGCDWVLQVLDDAQPLQAITTLRLPTRERLRPVVV